MISMSVADAARVLDGQLLGAGGRFVGVSTDSRTLEPGALFFALRGPNFDAHDMLDDVASRQAAAAVVQRDVAASLTRIVVNDTREALGLLAAEWRRRFAIPLVAITGSAGKTTVKEMTAAILSRVGDTLSTEGNLNNDIGVPLTLFRLGANHEAAVVEMGANQPGDIIQLVRIARPTVSVLTLAAAVHLEGFGSVEMVARTKGEIISGLAEDGVAIINADDAFAPMWREMAGSRRLIEFGEDAAVRARDLALKNGRQQFRLVCDVGEATVSIAHKGRHNVTNALAATAAARACGVPLETIVAGLEAAQPVAGRLKVRRGPGGVRLIDDSYNASPASLKAALDVLADEPGEHWLVLGDMAELGDAADAFHHEAGRYAASSGVVRLYSIGQLARAAHDAFGDNAEHFDTLASLIEALRDALATSPKDLSVLIKGSRVMTLDRVADALEAGGNGPC